MSTHVLVLAHGERPEAVQAEAETRAALARHGLTAVSEDELADVPGDLAFTVVLGGDGTILRAAELTRERDTVLLGVNLGHVGFLAEAEREDIASSIDRMAAGDFTVEARNTLEVQILDADGNLRHADWALNEAAVEKQKPIHMIEVIIEVDHRPLSSFGCDGIIFSTATGSTAHAFSGGGPVIWPGVDAMVLVPMAAHALFARPLVVGPEQTLAMELVPRSRSAAALVCDGRRMTPVLQGERVEVRRSANPVRLARLTTAPFADRLVSKFNLPVTGWRGQARARRAT